MFDWAAHRTRALLSVLEISPLLRSSVARCVVWLTNPPWFQAESAMARIDSVIEQPVGSSWSGTPVAQEPMTTNGGVGADTGHASATSATPSLSSSGCVHQQEAHERQALFPVG